MLPRAPLAHRAPRRTPSARMNADSWFTHFELEVELEPELQIPRLLGRGNRAECGGSKRQTWQHKVGVIGQVECFKTELQLGSLAGPELPKDGKIHVDHPWAFND